MKATASRESGPDMQVHEIQRDGMCELFVTHAGAGIEGLEPMARELMADWGTEVVCGECFTGPLTGLERPGAAALANLIDLPLTWVFGGSGGDGLGGVHLRAVSGGCARMLELDGVPLGMLVEGAHADEVILAGIHCTDVTASRTEQARASFERIEEGLELAGMDYSHVVRTWLYLDDILSWYGDFNGVRTAFYTERGVFDRLVPASTGIGGSNPFGAAMMAGAYAVRPKSPGVTIEAVPSPLQCPALDYGSSFSRAVEVTMPDMRRLLVSGTASIDPDGKTAHRGDLMGQTALTCDVIEAILESRDMGWEDVTRATAYVRFAEDAGVLERHCAVSGMPRLPVVVAQNTVCRDDLLFELEVDAVQAR